MTPPEVTPAARYETILTEFLKVQSEKALYEASLLSKNFIEQGLGPEEIVALHSDTMARLLQGVSYIEQARLMALSLQFLLETMITYGIRYKEYLDLRMSEATRAIEMQMQVERIKAEEAIRVERARAAERIQAQAEALRSKEDFVAFMAHELRNPITVIRGSIEYALHRVRQDGSDAVQRALTNAQGSLDRLMRMTDELMVLGREEKSNVTLAVSALPLADLLEMVVNDCRDTAEQKGLTLDLALQPPVPAVYGDREWLRTAFDNLLSNALKYTPAAGHITVRTINHPRRVQIDVVDTGVGIPIDALPHIFEKYYRIHNNETAFIKGTGLGLALVKRIIERHGGDVTVQSEVGQGSVFSVYLPLGTQQNNEAGTE